MSKSWKQVNSAVNGGSEPSEEWMQNFRHHDNACANCQKTCNFCLEEGYADEDIKYQKPIDEDERETSNTWVRWVMENWVDIKYFIEQNFHQEDWDFQKGWMIQHPKTAFNMLNDYELPNRVRIAKVLDDLIGAEYGVTIIVGRQNSGKSWTFLWLAEAMKNHNSDKKIYYIGDESMNVPDWMTVINNFTQAENDSWICMDEASARAKARDAMTNVNRWLTTLATRVAHRDIHLFFISQRPELVDKNLRRLALSFIIKPMSLHENQQDMWRALEPYIPNTVARTGYYSTTFNTAYEFYQPAPLSPERENFTKMFRDSDVTKKGEGLFGKPNKDKKEENTDPRKGMVKLKPEQIEAAKKYEENDDLSQRDLADEHDVSNSTISQWVQKYRNLQEQMED